MKSIFTSLILLAVSLSSAVPAAAQKKLNVVTTLPDFAYIASEIGGDRVETFAIAAGYQDPHFVDPKPSYIVKLSRADIFVTVGLDLEAGWVPPLLNSARNDKIQRGGPGYVDASTNVPLLEVPTSTSREQGDIHAYGNPHYWMDPANGLYIAQNIAAAFVRTQPQSEDYFNSNLASFESKLQQKIVEWDNRMHAYRGTKVIAYHNLWPYFEKSMGFKIVDFLEPKPGIPPSPSQLAKIIRLMNEQEIRTIIIAPYYRQDSAKLVARRTNATVVPLASSVQAFEEVKTYFDVFEYDINLLIDAFEKGRQ